MKYFIIIALLFTTSFTWGQSFPNTPADIGSPSTILTDAGAHKFKKGVVIGNFADSTAANAVSYIKYTPYIIISITGGILLQRNETATAWVQIGGSTKVDSVTESNDSLYYWINGSSTFIAVISGSGTTDTVITKFPIYTITGGPHDSIAVYGVDSSFQSAARVGDSIIFTRFNGSTQGVYAPTSGGGGGSGITELGTPAYGLTRTNDSTYIVDTTVIASKTYVDNKDALKLNISDTAAMMAGSVRRVHAGTNVTVDNTDPLNPVVSSTGGVVITKFPLHTITGIGTDPDTLAVYNVDSSFYNVVAVNDSLLRFTRFDGTTKDVTVLGKANSAPGTTGWALTGNSGTDTATNFIGTTDNVQSRPQLRFRVNSVWAGVVDSTASTYGNTVLGFGASPSRGTTAGTQTTAFGYKALASNNSGLTGGAFDAINNTAVGMRALQLNTIGRRNTAFGFEALRANIIGNFNTGIGNGALLVNTGSFNTALGDQSLISNTSGGGNVGVGSGAISSLTIGNNNTALGSGALGIATGTANTVAGGGGGGSNSVTTGSQNTGLGFSVNPASTGNYNIAIGAYVTNPTLTASSQLNIGNVLYGTGLYNGGTNSSTPTATGSIGVGIVPTSQLHTAGSFATGYAATPTSITANATHNVIEVTATGQTITLPTAVGIQGRIYTIKLTAVGTGTVATTSSQTIDGITTYSLLAQYKYVTVQSNNANWNIIGNN
jgi:hypothetical protein